jgi:hypothetical protein
VHSRLMDLARPAAVTCVTMCSVVLPCPFRHMGTAVRDKMCVRACDLSGRATASGWNCYRATHWVGFCLPIFAQSGHCSAKNICLASKTSYNAIWCVVVFWAVLWHACVALLTHLVEASFILQNIHRALFLPGICGAHMPCSALGTQGKPRRAQETSPGEPRRSPGELRRAQASPEEPRRPQESPGEPRKAQESPGEPRKAQESPGEPRRA